MPMLGSQISKQATRRRLWQPRDVSRSRNIYSFRQPECVLSATLHRLELQVSKQLRFKTAAELVQF